MEELLMQAALETVAAALPGAALFTEKVRQGYQTPAVFLILEQCSVKREMGCRFRAEGEISLRVDPGKGDALAAGKILGKLEAAFRGKKGLCLENGKVAPDGVAEAVLKASAVAFSAGEPPAMMGKMDYSLVLGEDRKDG